MLWHQTVYSPCLVSMNHGYLGNSNEKVPGMSVDWRVSLQKDMAIGSLHGGRKHQRYMWLIVILGDTQLLVIPRRNNAITTEYMYTSLADK